MYEKRGEKYHPPVDIFCKESELYILYEKKNKAKTIFIVQNKYLIIPYWNTKAVMLILTQYL